MSVFTRRAALAGAAPAVVFPAQDSPSGAPLPVSKTASLRLPVETMQVSQKALDLRCEVLGQAMFNPFENPLVDPLRDLSLQPYSRDELRRIRDVGSRLSSDANKLLQQSGR